MKSFFPFFLLFFVSPISYSFIVNPSFTRRQSTKCDYSSTPSPVLSSVYPALLQHNQTYGHPNIPLGSPEGRACHVLRRLAIQGKLLSTEIQQLQELGFRFHTLEDVYHVADFDDIFTRLIDYEAIHQNSYQVPKKYPLDPELGAWVTGVRRLGPNKIASNHVDQLTAISFPWTSVKQCGSQFMKYYRDLLERVEQEGSEILQEPQTLLWKQAQRTARANGTVSETRYQYLVQLFGTDWDTE